MKKTFMAITFTAYLLSTSSCLVFKKREKYGCLGTGSNIGAERLATGDEKALRASSRAGYKGRKSY